MLGLACANWKLRTRGQGDKELLALSPPGSPCFAAQNGYEVCRAPGSAGCQRQRVWLVPLCCRRAGGWLLELKVSGSRLDFISRVF